MSVGVDGAVVSPLRSKAQLSCSPFLFNATQGSSLDLTSRPPQRHRNISISARDVNRHHTGRHTNDNETENTCHRPPRGSVTAPPSPVRPAGLRPGLGIVADCPCSSVPPPPGRCPCRLNTGVLCMASRGPSIQVSSILSIYFRQHDGTPRSSVLQSDPPQSSPCRATAPGLAKLPDPAYNVNTLLANEIKRLTE